MSHSSSETSTLTGYDEPAYRANIRTTDRGGSARAAMTDNQKALEDRVAELESKLKQSNMLLRRAALHDPQPMPPQTLYDIYRQLDMTKKEDACFWAICLTSFYLFAPQSQLMECDGGEYIRLKDCEINVSGYTIRKGSIVKAEYSFSSGKELMTNAKPYSLYYAICGGYIARKGSESDFLFACPGIAPTTDPKTWWVEERLHDILDTIGCTELYDFRSLAKGGMDLGMQIGVKKSDVQGLANWSNPEASMSRAKSGWMDIFQRIIGKAFPQ